MHTIYTVAIVISALSALSLDHKKQDAHAPLLMKSTPGVDIPSEAEAAQLFFDVKSITISAPSSCDPDKSFTITVTVKVRSLIGGGNVTLFEDDVLNDDEIATQQILRLPGDKRGTKDFSEALSFTFRPADYEKGKKLELYAKAGGVKSAVVTIQNCK
jgi:hypothetical protein